MPRRRGRKGVAPCVPASITADRGCPQFYLSLVDNHRQAVGLDVEEELAAVFRQRVLATSESFACHGDAISAAFGCTGGDKLKICAALEPRAVNLDRRLAFSIAGEGERRLPRKVVGGIEELDHDNKGICFCLCKITALCAGDQICRLIKLTPLSANLL